MKVSRRPLLLGILAGGLGGCLELESAAFSPGDDDESDDDGDDNELEGDVEADLLLEQLGVVEVTVESIELDGQGYHIETQTRGNVDEEINRIASAYSSIAENIESDISVRIQDRGLTQENFRIEHEWGLSHARGEIDDGEYMELIRETL